MLPPISVVPEPAESFLTTYRESNGHVASEFCRLIVRTSDDAGHTWSEAQVIRNEDKSTGVLTTWNCPKIQQLKDGRILLLCDTYLFPPGEVGRRGGELPYRALVQR